MYDQRAISIASVFEGLILCFVLLCLTSPTEAQSYLDPDLPPEYRPPRIEIYRPGGSLDSILDRAARIDVRGGGSALGGLSLDFREPISAECARARAAVMAVVRDRARRYYAGGWIGGYNEDDVAGFDCRDFLRVARAYTSFKDDFTLEMEARRAKWEADQNAYWPQQQARTDANWAQWDAEGDDSDYPDLFADDRLGADESDYPNLFDETRTDSIDVRPHSPRRPPGPTPKELEAKRVRDIYDKVLGSDDAAPDWRNTIDDSDRDFRLGDESAPDWRDSIDVSRDFGLDDAALGTDEDQPADWEAMFDDFDRDFGLDGSPSSSGPGVSTQRDGATKSPGRSGPDRFDPEVSQKDPTGTNNVDARPTGANGSSPDAVRQKQRGPDRFDPPSSQPPPEPLRIGLADPLSALDKLARGDIAYSDVPNAGNWQKHDPELRAIYERNGGTASQHETGVGLVTPTPVRTAVVFAGDGSAMYVSSEHVYVIPGEDNVRVATYIEKRSLPKGLAGRPPKEIVRSQAFVLSSMHDRESTGGGPVGVVTPAGGMASRGIVDSIFDALELVSPALSAPAEALAEDLAQQLSGDYERSGTGLRSKDGLKVFWGTTSSSGKVPDDWWR